ncbi:LysE family translocator [Roseivivax sp. THAF30]|uniref:LysE family translocator n=1 Tax=Roseivivax sp. THAF30 TaxID=2587852 RepID=UPI001268A92E|nr:LysE family translocator [Roseivivax sp. THAF30]QFT61797.1 Leucine efflux protein [Roseivivax sp. THAF30]
MPLEFLAIVLMVVLIPGVDQLMVLRNTLAKGRVAGLATAIGIGTASSVQALLASLGIGAVIVASQPVFEAIRWLGVAYLLWMGFSSLRSAVRGTYEDETDTAARGPLLGFRDGVLCNITNPKMLVFYLALLPQFVGATGPVVQWVLFAMMVPLLGTLFLIALTLLIDFARRILLKRIVRRTIDGTTGLLLVAFGLRLAREA